jgi:carboxyl-terminal processing protease
MRSFFVKASFLVGISLTFFNSNKAFALVCNDVQVLTHYYLKTHFAFSDFTDTLSQRTLELFIRTMDPGKVYFLQADIDRFDAAYKTRIDELVQQKDCSFINDVVETYEKRFLERSKDNDRILELKHDFSVEEYLEVDRKKLPWAKTSEELSDRWRKRLKFQVMQLKESIDNPKLVKEKMQKRMALVKKRQSETTQTQVFGFFLNSFAMAMDPHSDYMGPDELEEFRINTRLSLEGIGAVLRSEDGFTSIQSLVPGGAAALSGQIMVDDKIVAVAQAFETTPVDVIDMDLKDVVKLIRGKENTEVTLVLLRDDKGEKKQLRVTLKRQKVQLTDRAAKSRMHIVKVGQGETARMMKVGVVVLPSFYLDFEGREKRRKDFRSSTVDTLREINTLKSKGVEAIVVDLRNNGGGSLDEAIAVSGLFITKGPIVQVRGNEKESDVLADRDPMVAWDGPLAVIINRQSASASEIFAGAIQDYGRGLIVGDSHTFGKGTVQNLNDLSEKLGAVKVTISKFYRPGGSSTQLKGVESDIVFPDLMDELELGEKFYDYALPWEKIPEANFKPLNLVSQHLGALKTRSAARIEKDPDFLEIMKDIKKYKENEVERTRLSLKEKSAKERAEEKAKTDAKSKGKKATDDEDGDKELHLIDDPMLQESIRVTSDLVSLTKGQALSQLSLPEVETEKMSRDMAEKKVDAKSDKKQVKSAKPKK